jgi:hypothetical protein
VAGGRQPLPDRAITKIIEAGSFVRAEGPGLIVPEAQSRRERGRVPDEPEIDPVPARARLGGRGPARTWPPFGRPPVHCAFQDTGHVKATSAGTPPHPQRAPPQGPRRLSAVTLY